MGKRKRKRKRTQGVSCNCCGDRAIVRRFGYNVCRVCFGIRSQHKLASAADEWQRILEAACRV